MNKNKDNLIWEEEFDKKFPPLPNLYAREEGMPNIKQHIQSLLSQRDKEILEKLEEMEKDNLYTHTNHREIPCDDCQEEYTFIQVLQEVKEFILKEKE